MIKKSKPKLWGWSFNQAFNQWLPHTQREGTIVAAFSDLVNLNPKFDMS